MGGREGETTEWGGLGGSQGKKGVRDPLGPPPLKENSDQGHSLKNEVFFILTRDRPSRTAPCPL